jgi:hypothetical protein
MAFYRTALIISVKKKSIPALVQSMKNSVDFVFFHRAEICISKEELDCSYPFGTLSELQIIFVSLYFSAALYRQLIYFIK